MRLRCGDAVGARGGRGLLWRVAEAAKISNGTALRVSWRPRERGSSLLMDRCPVGGRGKLRHFFFLTRRGAGTPFSAHRGRGRRLKARRVLLWNPHRHTRRWGHPPALGRAQIIAPIGPLPSPRRHPLSGRRRQAVDDRDHRIRPFSSPRPPPRHPVSARRCSVSCGWLP